MREATGTGGRERRRALAAAALLACLGLGACGGKQGVSPTEAWREISGARDAARPAPPGLDRPFPSLASVPPRPDRPSPEARDAITAALAADRSRSREPVSLRSAGGGGDGAPAGMAAGPPPRPALAAAPGVPWTVEAPVPRGGGTPAATPAAPATLERPPPVPVVPDAAPAPPPPDLLGAPPPPPAPDLLAPPPPSRR